MDLLTHADKTTRIPQTVVPGFRLIEDQLEQVKNLINQQLTISAKTADINRLLEHLKNHRGKMIRPGLVLLAGRSVGKVTDKHIHVAAIVQMIHNASLLHDDVIDEGQKRRGLPTINNLWGNESAVLLGDLLLSQVFKMCISLGPKITKIIAATAARTCEGELRQVIERQNWQLSEAEYIDIITAKSATFFSSCCRLGALLAQAAEFEVESLTHFGLNAGIAFQITDDLLDLIGHESQIGKTTGSDVEKNKPTLALIHLLTVVEQKEKNKIYSKLNQSVNTNRNALLKMLRTYGSLEHANNRAQGFVDKALQSLSGLKQSRAKDALIETAKFMANRAI